MSWFEIVSAIIAILGFIQSSIHTFKNFKKSRETIKIDFRLCDQGRIYLKKDYKYAFSNYLFYNGINLNEIEKVLIYKLEYYLVNDTDKIITITDISYFWEYPITLKKIKLKENLLLDYEFYSEFFGSRLRRATEHSFEDLKLKPGNRILIKDILHAPPVVNQYIQKNILRWKKYCKCQGMPEGFDFHYFPPRYGLKIVVSDIKGRKVEKILNNNLWEKPK